MSLLRTGQLARQAVGFFNIKHFHSRQKFALTPDNVVEVFRTQLHPNDRLLRQARVGGGATRVLVIDKNQRVKGIYNPLLCLPHPAVVPRGESVLGVTVEEYLGALAETSGQHMTTARHTVAGASTLSTAATPASLHGSLSPCTMVVLSHPDGIALACFTADGATCMPLQNQTITIYNSDKLTAPDDHVGSAPSSQTSPTLGRQTLVRLINAHYDSCLSACRTFFFLTRDGAHSLSLQSLQQHEWWQRQEQGDTVSDKTEDSAENEQSSEADEAGAVKDDALPSDCSRISFTDPRWIVLPDTVLHTNRSAPLYSRDPATGERIVNAEGLRAGVTHGVLFLDVMPQNVPTTPVP